MEARLLPASLGVGPLLQRDYWAVFPECTLKPSQLIQHVREHFCEFPPKSLVQFVADKGMEIGAQLSINIHPAQQCAVQVVHTDAQSFTLGTLEGHPEAGRITFGAYRNTANQLVFHIRSRARSSATYKWLGFLAIGDAMQTNTWTDFITNVAAALQTPIPGVIRAETEEVEAGPEDGEPLDTPTYRAVGD